ncbi:MAG: hypothetical protein JW713_05830 [Pontiellaceae bacterium]|nr:hypothetical protein [Pontiellaceae bacterium]
MTYALSAAQAAPTYAGQFPTASGVQSYHGTYIPQIWSANILEQFYAGTCLTKITNSDYEGEIKAKGDTVHIRTGAEIEDFEYEIGGGVNAVTPKPGIIELVVDKSRGYAFNVNPLVTKQADVDFVAQWSRDASERIKINIERAFFADVYADAHEANQGNYAGNVSGGTAGGYNLGSLATPFALTKSNAVEFITSMDSVMTENDVPLNDRFAVLPEWMCHRLQNSDLKNANEMGDSKSPVRTGIIGRIGHLDIYSSNLLYHFINTTDSNSKCCYPVFGQKSAMTFAWQLVMDEELPNPTDFGRIHRGLQVYGYKVVRPEALGTAVVKAG